MHDVIRDFAISISIFEDGQQAFVKAGCKLRGWPKIPAQKGYSAMSVMKNDICKLPEDLVCSKLQILLLQRNAKLREIPEFFFQSSKVLRVLDLSKTRISLLPTSFCLLTNLHTLYLDGCRSIGDMSYLGKLKNLEILSMRDCRPKESKFPKEIGDLTNLRMLDMTNLQVDSIPSKVISRLSKLEELHMLCDISWEWGSKVAGDGEETSVGFEELIGLSYLNMLKVRIPDAECLPKNVVSNPNWFKFDIFLGILLRDRDHYSRALSLNRVINALPDWFINVVVEKAEKLRYFECEELANIVVEHDHGRLHALKYLVIEGAHENLEELLNTTTRVSNEPVLEKLEELDIRYVDGLKQLCVGELPPGSLCNLKKLDVAGCLDLGNTLLPSKLLQRLENLEDLTCEEMNGMEYVFGSSSSLDCLEPQHMTNLRILKLWDLENLINIWNGPAPHAIFHNLKALIVFKCMNLKSLFTSAVAQGLLQLEDLWVEKCLSIERLIIEPSEENVKNNKMIIVFPELKNLVLYDLPRLSGFCNSGSANIHIKCPSLEHLHLKDCPQFSTFASHFRCSNKVKVNFKGHYDILYHRYVAVSLSFSLP